ncbi:MAG TPA: metal ABC transporter ATP-binding protein [Methanothrix sp.]|jgi:zinc transport system ATP-binding protein|uniref:metal ABC transporter ATP-binding protein n=2 Tax=Methanothrix sp. TaxID=90426 RepID=UPI002B76A312|nr:metal ABC transporter ATP-binding protein [Methanothrix sp.]MDI9417477.1 metal ABC transporter ATP-binding protein [Euryarchaeota archaeon]HON36606.1 metal ABC transporter ATP-binding protein [Methanothrix sp.]HRU75616.1 metal ABC transporter ATP-binding protein [Methanothrix sp.]
MTSEIVSIENLWLFRGEHVILEDINLRLNRADFLGLIGPNGGGKSTLLKLMLGLIKPDKGRIRIFGQQPEAARGMIGYLPQKTIFDQSFPVKVLEVAQMGRFSRTGLFRRYGPADRDAALRALEAVGMEDRAEREIGALSGGEQQRVFVARSLVSDPELLLLDEPTAGIDSAQQAEFYELLCHLNQDRGIAIILVSHDITAVSKYVGKIACLNQRLYYHGSKELTSEDIEKAYGCPVDLIAHGTPHRVLRKHD